jgi:hypothetical protein
MCTLAFFFFLFFFFNGIFHKVLTALQLPSLTKFLEPPVEETSALDLLRCLYSVLCASAAGILSII